MLIPGKNLNRIYSLVVLWEEGWGEEKNVMTLFNPLLTLTGVFVLAAKIYDEEKALRLMAIPVG